jgi:HEAT repeat protein
MKKKILIPVLFAIASALILFWQDTCWLVAGRLRGESFYAGRPTSFWKRSLKDFHVQISSTEFVRQNSLFTSLLDYIFPKKHNKVAIPAILSQPDEQALGVLSELLNENDPDIRFQVVRCLGKLASDVHCGDVNACVAALIKYLSDPDDKVRLEAIHEIEELSKLANKAAVRDALIPLLVMELQNDSKKARCQTAYLLGFLCPTSQQAADGLRRILHDADHYCRVYGAVALIKMGTNDGAAINIVSQELKVRSALRDVILMVIADAGVKAGCLVPNVIPLLYDKSADVRYLAVCALREIDAAEMQSIPHLHWVLDDDDGRVRSAAQVTLSKLTNGTAPFRK